MTYNRPDWDNIFMEICETISKRSTCVRIQTASIIIRDTNIISIGYNGVPSGQEHCKDYWYKYWKKQSSEKLEDIDYDIFITSNEFYRNHHEYSIQNELHAEMNAILQSETGLKNCVLYTIYSPCIQCAKAIVSAKIGTVIYKKRYHRDIKGIEFLKKHDVYVKQLE